MPAILWRTYRLQLRQDTDVSRCLQCDRGLTRSGRNKLEPISSEAARFMSFVTEYRVDEKP